MKTRFIMILTAVLTSILVQVAITSHSISAQKDISAAAKPDSKTETKADAVKFPPQADADAWIMRQWEIESLVSKAAALEAQAGELVAKADAKKSEAQVFRMLVNQKSTERDGLMSKMLPAGYQLDVPTLEKDHKIQFVVTPPKPATK